MHSLSEHASVILERMEPDLLYGPDDLRAFLPDTTDERLREIMHELWINRQVERVDYSGWRRHRSASPHVSDASSTAGDVQSVTPGELFDHDTFAGFFK
jgi:hypothetical protein